MFSFSKLSVFIALISVSLYGIRKWCDGGVCESKARLDGKTVVITGGNTGIGKETAIDLAKRGAKVILGCRSKKRGENALVDIKQQSGSDNVHLLILDLASLASIRAFADDIIKSQSRLDILINNAGIFSSPNWKTEDGFEIHFGVNHLGHFLLTNLLLDLIVKSAPSRIVVVSSLLHRFPYYVDFETVNDKKPSSSWHGYGVSKLANVLFAKELSRHLKGRNVSVFSLHPGVISSEIGRHVQKSHIAQVLENAIGKLYLKDCKQGAQTTICCAVEEGLEKYSGEYFADCGVATTSSLAKNETLGKELWDISMKMTKLKGAGISA